MQGNLTPRDVNMIKLGEMAEQSIQHQQQQRRQRGSSSISHREYDVGESRREWETSFQ